MLQSYILQLSDSLHGLFKYFAEILITDLLSVQNDPFIHFHQMR